MPGGQNSYANSLVAGLLASRYQRSKKKSAGVSAPGMQEGFENNYMDPFAAMAPDEDYGKRLHFWLDNYSAPATEGGGWPVNKGGWEIGGSLSIPLGRKLTP